MLTHSQCLHNFDLNIKGYCTSKHAKRKNSYKRYKFNTEDKLAHKYKKQWKKSMSHNLDVIDVNNTKNYNLLYLQKFSNVNLQHVKSKDYRTGPILIRDTRPYNKHEHDKYHNLKSKDYYFYECDSDIYYHYDDLTNWRNCHRSPNRRNNPGYEPLNDFLIEQRQFREIEERCNWNNIRLSAAKRLSDISGTNRGCKYQILLVLNNRSQHLLFEVHLNVLIYNPVWFRDWVMKQWKFNYKRYRKECFMKKHINKELSRLPLNYQAFTFEDIKEDYIPPICRGCKLYCCKSCICMRYCKDCAIDFEYKRIYKCLLSIMDGFDAGIVRILTKYAMGKIITCSCGKERYTDTRFQYNKIKIAGALKCRMCRYREQREAQRQIVMFYAVQFEEMSWKPQRIPVRYNIDNYNSEDVKKYQYRYSSRGFSAFLERTEEKLPIKSGSRKWRGDTSERKIKNALFINRFDILGEQTHSDLTNLLLTYGDLAKHVYIDLDRNKNPFAIVQFVNDSAAEWCKLDGIKTGKKKKLNIEWVDRDIDEMQYDEDKIVTIDFDTNIIDGEVINYDKEDIKLYNKSKRNRESKYKKENKRTKRKEKFGKNNKNQKNQKSKRDRKWKDKKMNKRSNKRLLDQCCKIVLENIKRNNYIDYISF